MRPKVYVETTVISYLASRSSRDLIVAANQQITQDWWHFRRTEFDLYVSQLVVRESASGDEEAAQKRLQLLDEIPSLRMTKDASTLARSLVEEGAVPQRAVEDALHIAIATVNGVDYLITWNFKHIANAAMRSKIERVCRMQGYEPPVICSPQELLEEE